MTPWTATCQASLSFTNSYELTQTHVHQVGDNYPTISSSVVPFSSWLQSFPASGSFPRSQFFPSGVQSIGVSASASVLLMYIQDWFWNWNSNSLATRCEELTHLKRPWCWERLRAGGEGDDRGWDGWMASLTRWTWVWVNSRSWWGTGRPGVLRFMGSQRLGHDWATEQWQQ